MSWNINRLTESCKWSTEVTVYSFPRLPQCYSVTVLGAVLKPGNWHWCNVCLVLCHFIVCVYLSNHQNWDPEVFHHYKHLPPAVPLYLHFLYHLWPLASTNLFSISIILSFWEFHVVCDFVKLALFIWYNAFEAHQIC